jgi:hypothetical protein
MKHFDSTRKKNHFWMLGSGGRAFSRPNFAVAQAFFEHSVMVKECTGHRRARDLFQLTTQSCEF